MIYHRFLIRRSGLPEPSSVILICDPIRWLEMQVRSEFEVLFPESTVALNQEAVADWIVLVFQDRRTAAARQVNWGKSNSKRASAAIGIYCLNPRQFDLIPTQDFDGWARKKRILAFISRWRDGLLRVFRPVGS